MITDKMEKKVLTLVNTYFTDVMAFNDYRLQKPWQEYNGHIPGKIAEWDRYVDVQTKAVRI